MYIKTFYGIHRLGQVGIPLPPFLRPVDRRRCVAGLLGLGLYYAWDEDRYALAVLGTGYGTLQEALANPDAAWEWDCSCPSRWSRS